MTGQQLLARNLRMVRTKNQADSLFNLGGEALSVASDFTSAGAYAYIPISVWCPPSEDELSVPLPGDALGQQIQITVTLNPPSAFWSQAITITSPAPVSDVPPPTTFSSASFSCEQLVMLDRGMAMANRVNLETHSYGMPMSFDQQQISIELQPTASPQPVVLTGFRAGSCRQLQIYATLKSDTLLGVNLNKFYTPVDVTVLYGGVIYAQYLAGSSAIWNLLDGTKPSAVDVVTVSQPVAGGPFVPNLSELSEYVLLPFGQPTGSDYAQDLLTHGKEISNGIVNLQVTMPDARQYTLHVIYNYQATVSFSRGSAEIIF